MKNTNKQSVSLSMLATIFILWCVLNTYFLGRYLEIISNQINIAPKVIAILIIGWIVLSSFYACFHVVSFLFSLFMKQFCNAVPRNYARTASVAILYPCMNDLKENAVISLLKQEYPSYHLYTLDDSTLQDEQKKADQLQIKNPDKITIIRRPTRNGFKAGNLNYALEQIKHKYKYFAVMDADEVAPVNFLKETVAIAEANPHIGFIQASHKQYGDTEYGKRTGDGLDLHWSYFLPARNRFGFVYFYGHGALIRTKAYLDVGGFPEIVSEDIALAVKIREAGYRGYFADDIICEEEVPPTYKAWRKRNGKVICGTLEFLVKVFPSFAKSRNISLAEKLDLMISSSILFLPILFLCFIVLLHFVMPFFSQDSYSISGSWLGTSDSGYIRTAMGMFKPLWGWDTLLFTVFTIFSPLCYLIPNLLRAPLKVFKYTWLMTTIHLSGTVHIFFEVLGWLWTRRAVFIATANRSEVNTVSPGIIIECIVGFLIILCSVSTGSLCLMATGLSIAMVPLLIRKNLQGRLCMSLALLPMALTLVTFGMVPFGLLGVTGVFAGIALAHH